MKKPFLLLTFLVLIPALAYAGALVEFESTDHDFGRVQQGKQLRYDFVYINAGDEDLLIRSVSPS